MLFCLDGELAADGILHVEDGRVEVGGCELAHGEALGETAGETMGR